MSKHFKRIVVPFSDPDQIVIDDMDDATEVYGEWPEIDTPCDESPSGQCEYRTPDYETCIHCGRKV